MALERVTSLRVHDMPLLGKLLTRPEADPDAEEENVPAIVAALSAWSDADLQALREELDRTATAASERSVRLQSNLDHLGLSVDSVRPWGSSASEDDSAGVGTRKRSLRTVSSDVEGQSDGGSDARSAPQRRSHHAVEAVQQRQKKYISSRQGKRGPGRPPRDDKQASGSRHKSGRRRGGETMRRRQFSGQTSSSEDDGAWDGSDMIVRVARKDVEKVEPHYKFWADLEPYFVPITEHHLRMLHQVPDDKHDPAYEVPPIGRHYLEQWHDEDLVKSGGSWRGSGKAATPGRSGKVGRPRLTSGDDADDEASAVQAAGGAVPGADTTFMRHTLSQRLLAALIEERSVPTSPRRGRPSAVSSALDLSTPLESPAPPAAGGKRKPGARQLDLEERVLAELRHVGIVGLDEIVSFENREDDEICQRLRICQNMLAETRRLNNQNRKHLYSLVHATIPLQERQQKLKVADQAVLDAFRKRKGVLKAAAKVKRTPSERYLDEARRALDKRADVLSTSAARGLPGIQPQGHMTYVASGTRPADHRAAGGGHARGSHRTGGGRHGAAEGYRGPPSQRQGGARAAGAAAQPAPHQRSRPAQPRQPRQAPPPAVAAPVSQPRVAVPLPAVSLAAPAPAATATAAAATAAIAAVATPAALDARVPVAGPTPAAAMPPPSQTIGRMPTGVPTVPAILALPAAPAAAAAAAAALASTPSVVSATPVAAVPVAAPAAPAPPAPTVPNGQSRG